MITVKGFRYYNDSKCPSFEKKFENLGQLCYYIQQNAIGKKCIKFPVQNDDGSFNQQFASTFAGQLRFDDEKRYDTTNISTHIELIKRDNDEKILFSSGSLTDGKGHISTPMKQMLEKIRKWSKEEYEFAD